MYFKYATWKNWEYCSLPQTPPTPHHTLEGMLVHHRSSPPTFCRSLVVFLCDLHKWGRAELCCKTPSTVSYKDCKVLESRALDPEFSAQAFGQSSEPCLLTHKHFYRGIGVTSFFHKQRYTVCATTLDITYQTDPPPSPLFQTGLQRQ